jgi:transposase
VPAPRFAARFPKDDLQIVHRHAAGIDLSGRNGHFIAVEISETELEVLEVGGMTPDVEQWVAYLQAHGVTSIAMEATGVYWMPIYDALAGAGIEVYLVNPCHAKNVPGRPKDDKLDARWLQKLHKYGLLTASFRPSEEIRPLQSYWRQRTYLVRRCADAVRHQQKALDMMNLRPHKVLSDLDGVTGQRIVQAIVEGERDPAKLAAFRDKRCACTEEELQAAMTGYYQDHHLFALKQAYERYQFYHRQLAAIDEQLETVVTAQVPLSDEALTQVIAQDPHPLPHGKHAPTFHVAALIAQWLGVDPTTLPGIADQTALGLVSELGRDMSPWATDRRFGAFLGIAPLRKVSGGKVLSTRTRPGIHPAGVLFLQAAATITRSDTALGGFYRRLAVRLGKAKALTATAYKIARLYYHLLKEGRDYVEQGLQQYEERYQAQQLANLRKKAKRLGFELMPAA